MFDRPMHQRFKQTLAAAALSLAGLSLSAPAGAVDLEAQVQFSIPAQTLSSALVEFGRQANVQVMTASSDLDGLRTTAVEGRMPLKAALNRLLAGTRLRFEDAGLSSIAINRREENSASAASPADGMTLVAQPHGVASTHLAAVQQTNATDGAAGESSQDKVQEIIVTARKMNERLQDVPMSVSAISGEQLRERSASDVKDVLGSIPGLSFSGVDRGQSKYAIRGIATSNTLAPTVGVYLDDISLITNPAVFTGAFDVVFFDMERLEVLKGPQGTLYGGSAMGGAIKYVSARPNLTESTGSASLGMDAVEHGAKGYNGQGVVNMPLIEGKLAARAGVYFKHDGGYIDNVPGLSSINTAYSSTTFPLYTPLVQPSLSKTTEEDYNFSDTYAVRASLLWQPDPSWSIRPSIFYENTRLANSNYILPNQPGLTASYRFDPQETEDIATIYSLEVQKTLSNVQLTSLSGYFDRQLTFDRDYSFLVGGLINRVTYGLDTFLHYPFDIHTLSQELRIASAPDSESKFRWLAGVLYSDLEEVNNADIHVYGGTAVIGSEIGQGPPSQVDYILVQKAAFGEASYKLFDRLELTAGVRLFDLHQDSHVVNVGALVGNTNFQQADDASGTNPKVGLSYKIDDNHLLYTSGSKGFRPGGVVPPVLVGCTGPTGDLARVGFASAPTSYDSDAVWSYELGSKNQFGGLTLNSAVYYIEWKDIQQNIRLPNCGSNITVNAGDAEVKGAELDARVKLSPGLEIGANATYTDAEIVSTNLGSIAGASGIFKTGDDVLDMPEWMASAYTAYSAPLGQEWELRLRADYQYHGSQRRQFDGTQLVRFPVGGVYTSANPSINNPLPTEATIQDSYNVVNASATFNNGPVNLRLFVNNLLDTAPALDTNYTVGITRTTTLRPRTVGFEIRREF